MIDLAPKAKKNENVDNIASEFIKQHILLLKLQLEIRLQLTHMYLCEYYYL